MPRNGFQTLAVLLTAVAACCRPAIADDVAATQPAAEQAEPADESAGKPHWKLLAPMPLGVFSAGISVSEGRVVITGGLTQTGQLSTAVQVYDPKTNTWSSGPALKSGRKDHVQITLSDGRIMVVGGDQGDFTKGYTARADGEIIDLRLKKTTAIAEATRPMRDNTVHLLEDGRVLVVGPSYCHIYDVPTDTWKFRFKLRQSREGHASVMMPDGKVLVAGGLKRDSLELVDPVMRVSKQLRARLPHPLDDHNMTLLPDGRVWITGGQLRTGNTVERTWLVDLSGEVSSIKTGPKLNVPRGMADHVAALVDGKVIVAGGESQYSGRDTEHADARMLDPTTYDVSALPPMYVPHDDAVAAVIDGRLTIFGGFRVVRLRDSLPVPTAGAEVEQLVLPAASDNDTTSAQVEEASP